MDRRQRKSREAIFNAFILMLSKKNFNDITVAEIIAIADVGRATFYAHFETKDFLLKELCLELFGHVFSSERGGEDKESIFHCEEGGFSFLHLFKHIKRNDNNIKKLLSCQNNELFFEYFQNGVKDLVKKNKANFESKKPKGLPEDF